MNFIKKFLFTLVELTLMVVAFILFAGTAVVYEGKYKVLGKTTTTSKSFSGFDAFFGKSDTFDVSVGGVIVAVLVVIVVALAVLKIFASSKSKMINIAMLALCVVIAVMLFAGTTDLMLKFADGEKVAKHVGTLSAFGQSAEWSLKLGAGTIISGILVVISGVLAAMEAFVIKKK